MTFKEFLTEASGESSVDIRKEPYASKIEQILRKEIEKKYHFLGKLIKADFNRQYSSTKAEPSLFLYYGIKENNKDFGSTSREYKEWMTKLIDSGILESVNEILPGNKMLYLRHTWIAEDTVWTGERTPCYEICISFKIKAKPRATKPKKVRVARDRYSGDFRKIEAIVKDVLKRHTDGTEVTVVDCEIEGDNIYPTVIFSRLNNERAYEGRRILKNSLPDLEKALKNYPVEIPDNPRIWDDDEYDFVTMALPYNEDDE